MQNLLAQTNLGSPLEGFGPLGAPGGDAPSVFSNVISTIIGIITIVGIIWFVIILISGAIGIISAGGDKAAAENARRRITSGLIGLIVIISGLFLIDLIGFLIGIPDILDIPGLIGRIGI